MVILKRMGGNKTITVCLGDNVNSLYKRVEKMTGLSKKDFVLYIGDTALDKPTKKLYNAGVRDGNEIRVGIGGVGGGKRGGGGAGGYAKKTREQELKDFKEQISTMVMRISMSPKAVIINNIKDEALGLAKVMETNKTKAITTVLEKLDIDKLKRLSSDVVSCSPRASDRAKMMGDTRIIYTEFMAEIDEEWRFGSDYFPFQLCDF